MRQKRVALLLTVCISAGCGCAYQMPGGSAEDRQTASESGEPASDEIMKKVLTGDSKFMLTTEGKTEADIGDVPSLFDPYDTFMKIWEFSKVDLDGDGGDEVILFVVGAAGDMGGKVILHQSSNEVYGYLTDNRTLVELKTDGTFQFLDPAGSGEAGIGIITSFSEKGYTMECQENTSRQEEKQDADRYDFTEENIANMF